MKNNWPFINFKNAPLQIIDGDRGKNYPKQHEFAENGYCLFLNTGNVTPNGFDFQNCQFISEEKDNILRKGKLKRNDIVMTTRGTIGNVSFFNQTVPFSHIRINSGMVIFRVEETSLRAPYLYHFLRSTHFRKEVAALRSGAAQPQLPIRDIKVINIPLPPIDQQERIAKIVSTYDILIENNQQRIQLLEKSARLLYREWFIHLRFPGHEHSKIIDGVPEGWEKKTLHSFAAINQKSLKRKFQGEIEYIDIASVSTGMINQTTTMDFSDAPSRARRIVSHGDIIWSCVRPNRKSYSVIWKPLKNMIVSTGFVVISPKQLSLMPFIYYSTTTQGYVDYLSNIATGVAYPAVKPVDFQKSILLVPEKNILNDFAEFCYPIFEQIRTLQQNNQKLSQARDLLLPRLMNGEIEV